MEVKSLSKDIKITISDASKKSWTFTNTKELLNFIKAEVEFWRRNRPTDQAARNPHIFINASTILEQGLKIVEQWNNDTHHWDDAKSQQEIRNLKAGPWSGLENRWLWSGHAYANKYVDCYSHYGISAATAFINFILNKQAGETSNYYGFIGTTLAYEFLNQDSDLPKRRTAERKSLSQLRTTLDTTTSELVGQTEEFKRQFKEWLDTEKNDWEQWKTKSEQDRSTQLGEQRDKFTDYMETCKARILELETLYQEKLRLEKPALYWRNAARKYGIQGGLWSLALIASILLGLIYAHDFFTGWLQGKEIDLKLNTIQGVVIFGSIIATFVFLARTLAKMTFSSFHLMRDAEEREQLTYLYLALSEKSAIDQSSRDIVLQALFSRSETGLLSSDSGPTMPGIAEALRATERHK